MAAILIALDAVVGSGIMVTGELVFVCCVSGETGRQDAIRTLIEETGVRAEMAERFARAALDAEDRSPLPVGRA